MGKENCLWTTAIEIAVVLIKHFEGFYRRPYLCPAGVATVAWGCTRYPNGVAVTLSDPAVSPEQGMKFITHELVNTCLPAVLKLCPGADSPGRIAALLDFSFNAGVGNLKASTLRRKVNEQDWAEAKVQIMRWTKGGGRVLAGLVRRREAEANLL